MSNKDIEKRHHKTFEDLRQFDEGGLEFWYARDLQLKSPRTIFPTKEKWSKVCNQLAGGAK